MNRMLVTIIYVSKTEYHIVNTIRYSNDYLIITIKHLTPEGVKEEIKTVNVNEIYSFKVECF